MAFAIQLQHQSSFGTIEVHDVMANYMLAAKTVAGEAPAAKFSPQEFFGRGQVSAEFAGTGY
jgi:hypothetical protein